MSVIGVWERAFETRLELGEGARWVDGRFVFVDLLAGCLYGTTCVRPYEVRLLRKVAFPLGAVAPSEEGWIAAGGDGILFLGEHGRERWLARPAKSSNGGMRMNDASTSPDGRFWAGAMSYEATPGEGFLVRVDPDGSVTRVVEDLTIPNGPVFSPDGHTMYLADTPKGVIYSFEIGADGSVGPRSAFARVSGGAPDGMVVDAEGCLWSAIWGGSRIHRYSPDGELIEKVKIPAAQPTSLALATDPPYRLFVTTATFGRPALNRSDGCVLTAQASVAGVATPVFTNRIR